ncbi:hypothetical protein FQF65_18490, partial [Escherichia coli]|nr:hypothetical protein [Escherichia coli]
HNFFERIFALLARVAAGSVRDPCVHKKTRFFCAQVTGEQPAFQGVNSIPRTMSQRYNRMAVFLTLSVKKT